MAGNLSSIDLHEEAHALQVNRIFPASDILRQLEAVTFPKNPWSGCELYLRRCKAFGYITDQDSDFVVDVLNEDGDIIQDFSITKGGYDYLKRTLRLKVERD